MVSKRSEAKRWEDETTRLARPLPNWSETFNGMQSTAMRLAWYQKTGIRMMVAGHGRKDEIDVAKISLP
jgi:hypothetical protein